MLTKIQVHYEPQARGLDRCRDCKYFLTSGHCKIVEGTISPNGWCNQFEEKKMDEKKMPHAGHGFTRTVIEHHDDGSHTIHHTHEHGPEFDKKYAVEDLDAAHDGVEEHLGEPNDGEEAENHEHPSHSELLQEIEELVHKLALEEKEEGE